MKIAAITLYLFALLIFLPEGLTAQTAKPLTVPGEISGLVAGTSIVLANHDTGTLTVKANGAFKFPVTGGPEYDITIQTQPDGLRCVVLQGSGRASATNQGKIVVTCPMAVHNSLVWMRCTHGQKWNVKAGNCTGTGKANSYGAVQLQFCDKRDDSCNGGSAAGTLSSGEIFEACNQLNQGEGTYGISTWRVPLKDELGALVVCTDGTQTPLNNYGTDPYKCGYKNGNYTNGTWQSPALRNDLFPNTISLEYWSATPDKSSSSAWYTAFQNGWTQVATKTGRSFLRCVAGP
jgi:hypothetical protein